MLLRYLTKSIYSCTVKQQLLSHSAVIESKVATVKAEGWIQEGKRHLRHS